MPASFCMDYYVRPQHTTDINYFNHLASKMEPFTRKSEADKTFLTHAPQIISPLNVVITTRRDRVKGVSKGRENQQCFYMRIHKTHRMYRCPSGLIISLFFILEKKIFLPKML